MRVRHVVDGVEYRVLSSADAPAMASLLAEVFSRSEPMAVAAKLPAAQVAQMVECLVPKAIAEQITIVARDAMRGQLVGALLADDFGTAPPEGLDDAAPRFAPVGALLDGLDAPYRATTVVAPGTHAHLFMLGVAAHAGSRGIAGQLVAACLEQAHALGYRTAVTEATGAASQQVFRRAGFDHVATASYRDFVFGGERVFSAITDAEGTFLMTRDLDGSAPLPGTGAV